MRSIIQEDNTYCYICGRNANFEPLDSHHVYFGIANRKLSETYGLKIYIHHNTCHLNGIHKNSQLDKKIKAEVQEKAMEYYNWSIEDFIKIFGKNYL